MYQETLISKLLHLPIEKFNSEIDSDVSASLERMKSEVVNSIDKSSNEKGKIFEDISQKLIKLMIEICTQCKPKFKADIYNVNDPAEYKKVQELGINIPCGGTKSAYGVDLVYIEGDLFQFIQCKNLPKSKLCEKKLKTYRSIIKLNDSDKMRVPLLLFGDQYFYKNTNYPNFLNIKTITFMDLHWCCMKMNILAAKHAKKRLCAKEITKKEYKDNINQIIQRTDVVTQCIHTLFSQLMENNDTFKSTIENTAMQYGTSEKNVGDGFKMLFGMLCVEVLNGLSKLFNY